MREMPKAVKRDSRLYRADLLETKMRHLVCKIIHKASLLCGAGVLVVACSVGEPGQIHDPNEAANRKMHEFNKRFDRNFVGPIAGAYGKAVPGGADSALSNLSEHVAVPGEIVNSLLQLNFEEAILNTIRFSFNTVFGLGGLYDFATVAGVEDVDTDFGETLYVLGFPEGEYVELPGFGPSTERAAYGMVVDFFLDPLGRVLPKGSSKFTVPLYFVDKVGDRHNYAETVDSILYDSEDSYAIQRSIYLQNRRYKLEGGVSIDDLEDPYAD
ncbi:MAG: VacJ family lipoprotein [Rhodobacteraceae bacterium]|nr:VacJ family lipoprotein [Paracoccaceae bacterium]